MGRPRAARGASLRSSNHRRTAWVGDNLDHQGRREGLVPSRSIIAVLCNKALSEGRGAVITAIMATALRPGESALGRISHTPTGGDGVDA